MVVPMLPAPVVLACVMSAYSMGTKVAQPVGLLLKPLAAAAVGGAAISRPEIGLLGPFRVVGKGLGYLFGFARNNASSRIKPLAIQATDDLVAITFRRDVYQIGVSVLYVIIFVGGTLLIYKFAIYIIYKAYRDLSRSWKDLDEKSETPKLSKEQLKAIDNILKNPETLAYYNKRRKTLDTSYVVHDS